MDIAMFKTGAALTITQRSERGTSLAERMEDMRKEDDNVDYYYYSLNTTYYHQSLHLCKMVSRPLRTSPGGAVPDSCIAGPTSL